MIHQYKMNGYNIVLDVYSASVHVTDDLAYDAIKLLDEGKSEDEARALLRSILSRSFCCKTPKTWA